MLLYFLLSLLTYLVNKYWNNFGVSRASWNMIKQEKMTMLSPRMSNISKYFKKWWNNKTISRCREIHRKLECSFWGKTIFNQSFNNYVKNKKRLFMKEEKKKKQKRPTRAYFSTCLYCFPQHFGYSYLRIKTHTLPT